MHKKFEINWTKIKGGCQSGRRVVCHDSKSDLPLVVLGIYASVCTKIPELKPINILAFSSTGITCNK